jgi:tetratricopeptide (TPR) repeat protein
MPQVHLTATATGTFQAVPMPVSQPPAPAVVVDELSNSHRPSPSRVLAPAPVSANDDLDELDDNDPVLRWQRRRQWVLRASIASAVGLVVAAVVVVLLQRRPADVPAAVRLQVAAALTRGDDIARAQAMTALSTSKVPAAPAVRARLQVESARALREAVRLADDAVATAVANAAPGIAPGAAPPPAPPSPAPADAATTAERLLADAEAAVLTLRAAGVVDVDADLAAATIALTRGDAAGLEAAISLARDHARTLDDEPARAAVDDELRLLLTIAESTRLDPLDAEGATETISKLARFTDARAMAASAQLQLQRLRAARSMAMTKNPREPVDAAVVDAVGKAFSALPASDPRRTAGSALVLALSSLPVEPVVVDPATVVVDPNAPATPTATPTTPTTPTPPTTPTTPATPKVETPAGLLKQAWSALDAGRNSDALRLFGKVLSLSPSTSEAQFGKAEALRFAGRKDEAVAAYQRYLELDPSGKDANIAKNALKQLE